MSHIKRHNKTTAIPTHSRHTLRRHSTETRYDTYTANAKGSCTFLPSYSRNRSLSVSIVTEPWGGGHGMGVDRAKAPIVCSSVLDPLQLEIIFVERKKMHYTSTCFHSLCLPLLVDNLHSLSFAASYSKSTAYDSSLCNRVIKANAETVHMSTSHQSVS